MKKWRCTVCNYVHEGDTPPDKCPICGVGPDKFVLIEDTEVIKEKKWRCTVCNYIHVGETPPDKCPVCGVGPEKFVLVEEVEDGLTDKKERPYRPYYLMSVMAYILFHPLRMKSLMEWFPILLFRSPAHR